MFRYVCLFAMWIMVALTNTPRGSAHLWKTYINDRFQYRNCYPEDVLKPQGEAPNSDGQKYTGRGGEQVLVFGSNALGGTLSDDQRVKEENLMGATGKITYHKLTSMWYVVSGINGSNVFYVKTYLSGDQYKTFELTYPVGEEPEFNNVAIQMSKCFVDLRGVAQAQR